MATQQYWAQTLTHPSLTGTKKGNLLQLPFAFWVIEGFRTLDPQNHKAMPFLVKINLPYKSTTSVLNETFIFY
jgi:hypothetical protein